MTKYTFTSTKAKPKGLKNGKGAIMEKHKRKYLINDFDVHYEM
jgi:hypothetical protein